MKAIGPKLVIPTHNAGKLREIQELLAPHGIDCVGAAELGLPEPEEIGNNFIDNAELKAREAADLSGLPALADDSGLSVDALHGLPGRVAKLPTKLLSKLRSSWKERVARTIGTI